jgi:hypothetical protein
VVQDSDAQLGGSNMWIVIGLAALGFLIGNLVGLTAHSVVTALLSLIFAFTGGSVIALLGKVSPDDRRLAGQAICALSLTCLLGVYSGIAVSEWRVLSPRTQSTTLAETDKGSGKGELGPTSIVNKYLNSGEASAVESIDFQYRKHAITADDAYEQLYKEIHTAPQAAAPTR